jgi:hypothetical protein
MRGLLIERAPKEWREKIIAIPNEGLKSFIPLGRGEIIIK